MACWLLVSFVQNRLSWWSWNVRNYDEFVPENHELLLLRPILILILILVLVLVLVLILITVIWKDLRLPYLVVVDKFSEGERFSQWWLIHWLWSGFDVHGCYSRRGCIEWLWFGNLQDRVLLRHIRPKRWWRWCQPAIHPLDKFQDPPHVCQ